MHLPSDGNIFTPKSEPLSTLLSDIHRHKTALPNFQRPWVWEPAMVRDFIVSVAYRYPAGSLLTMPVANGTFALRPFEGSGEKLAQAPTMMVLDGQQRLTSLYQALFRREGVRHNDSVYHFYLDVKTLMSDQDGLEVGDPYFDEALFFLKEGSKGQRTRFNGLEKLYDLSTREAEVANCCLPLNCLFDVTETVSAWRDAFLDQHGGDNLEQHKAVRKSWDDLVQPWVDRIRTYPFPVVELQSNMPLNAICHIFEKVNSTGVALDVFDLATAILWSQGCHLNEEWRKTEEVLKPQLPMQPLSGTYFLQGISLLASMNRKRTTGDPSLGVACRKHDLLNLKKETVERWWQPLVAGYREAARFMVDEGILSDRVLPYTTLIVPLATVFADLLDRKGQIVANASWSKIRQWYWCCVFSQRYSSKIETSSAQDYEQVLRWIEGGDPPDVVRTFWFRSDVLHEVTSIRNAIYKGVLCLLARGGARDFGGSARLTTDLFYLTRQDHHHLFPIAALGQKGITDSRRDSIVNKTLISASINRSIGGRLPSEYLPKLPNPDESVRSHAVDPDILSSDDWHAFFRDRRARLRDIIKLVCGGDFQPFSDELEAPDAEDADVLSSACADDATLTRQTHAVLVPTDTSPAQPSSS